jgi:hypothetical protein
MVEAKLSFFAHKGSILISLFIPSNTGHYLVTDEKFISKNYGVNIKTNGSNRQAVWSIRKASGKQSLYYRSVIRQIDIKKLKTPPKPPEVEKTRLKGPYLEAAKSLVSEVYSRSADIDTLIADLFARLDSPKPSDNVDLLLGSQPSWLKKLDTATQILALAGIPSQIVNGIRLKKQDVNAPLIHWLEVYFYNSWRSYDPVTTQPNIPDGYLPWWRGRDPLVQLKGGDKLGISISVSSNQEEALRAAILRGKILNPFIVGLSLLNLPIHIQAVYAVLFLVPVGVFVLVFLRNIVGIKTFGTFMPVLIALAFRETQLIWGIVLFSLIVALGLGVRFCFGRLKLLVVPRLASVLIVVILLMAGLSLLFQELGLQPGLSVALFPMVILTMTIERMSIVWEERGADEALKQALGSLVAATLTYFAMNISYVKHLVFVFPELLVVLLAITLLLGRYSGYRLLELWRFKALIKDNP